MATFSKALEEIKDNKFAKREVVKNNTVITIYKKRLYQANAETGVRYPYVPTNADLLANDYIIYDNLIHACDNNIDTCMMQCTSCELSFDIETMSTDEDSNYFCPECWKELSPALKIEHEEMVKNGEIEE